MSLLPRLTPGAQLTSSGPAAYTLELPAGPKRSYRLAQLDDYAALPRKDFPWRPPLTLNLEVRVSEKDIPGTWGFGFWNDPFSLSLGLGGSTHKFPALPNAAWFFHASPENYLSLRNDLPANGLLAATFKSPTWPSALLALGIPLLPFLAWKTAARLSRRLGRRIVHQDATQINCDLKKWQQYALTWVHDTVSFFVNGENVFETGFTPNSRLGFLLWIDNQYAAFPPNGRLAYGTLANPSPASLAVRDLRIRAN